MHGLSHLMGRYIFSPTYRHQLTFQQLLRNNSDILIPLPEFDCVSALHRVVHILYPLIKPFSLRYTCYISTSGLQPTLTSTTPCLHYPYPLVIHNLCYGAHTSRQQSVRRLYDYTEASWELLETRQHRVHGSCQRSRPWSHTWHHSLLHLQAPPTQEDCTNYTRERKPTGG